MPIQCAEDMAEIYTADGLTAEKLFAKDPSVDLSEPSTFVKRLQLNCCA